jgi:hypothetical protein
MIFFYNKKVLAGKNFNIALGKSSKSQHRLSCSARLTLHQGSNILSAPPALVAQCTGTGGAVCKGATPSVEQ